jgi:formate hydrogenlyase subunit 3/multisubunit Na+/H+ antiporter MnhD subunit
MVSKDQGIGALIFIVCVIVAVAYFIALAFTPQLSNLFKWGWNDETMWHARVVLVAVPMAIALIAVLAIGAWIGWTMATTPPPKPIEEIEAEEKKEEEKPVEEEKAEEKEKEKEKKK